MGEPKPTHVSKVQYDEKVEGYAKTLVQEADEAHDPDGDRTRGEHTLSLAHDVMDGHEWFEGGELAAADWGAIIGHGEADPEKYGELYANPSQPMYSLKRMARDQFEADMIETARVWEGE